MEGGGGADQCRKGWSAGGSESLCGGDEGQINMKNRCLDRATKNRLTDVAGEQQKWSWVWLQSVYHIICTKFG